MPGGVWRPQPLQLRRPDPPPLPESPQPPVLRGASPALDHGRCSAVVQRRPGWVTLRRVWTGADDRSRGELAADGGNPSACLGCRVWGLGSRPDTHQGDFISGTWILWLALPAPSAVWQLLGPVQPLSLARPAQRRVPLLVKFLQGATRHKFACDAEAKRQPGARDPACCHAKGNGAGYGV